MADLHELEPGATGVLNRIDQWMGLRARQLLSDVARVGSALNWEQLTQEQLGAVIDRIQVACDAARILIADASYEIPVGAVSESEEASCQVSEVQANSGRLVVESAVETPASVPAEPTGIVVATDPAITPASATQPKADRTNGAQKTERRQRYEDEVAQHAQVVSEYFADKPNRWVYATTLLRELGLPKMTSIKFKEVIVTAGVIHNGGTSHGSAYGLFIASQPEPVQEQKQEDIAGTMGRRVREVREFFADKGGDWVGASILREGLGWDDIASGYFGQLFVGDY